jgi:hypothetical protein
MMGSCDRTEFVIIVQKEEEETEGIKKREGMGEEERGQSGVGRCEGKDSMV